MNDNHLPYLIILKDELRKRKRANSLYSLRSFAMNLELDPSLLSRLLNDKELPSIETADKICRKLKLSVDEAKVFMRSVSDEKICVELYKLNPSYTDCEP